MDKELTVGWAAPALQPMIMNGIHGNEKRLQNIEKRLENIEKLLLEIQQSLAKASGIETDESRN